MEEFVDPVDGTRWSVDIEFLSSRWTCIWDRGCEGVLDEPAAQLGQGCCSLGTDLLDDDEARRVAALAATLDASQFQHRGAAGDGVIDETGRHTRLVGGACIFLNRPGFAGRQGCALHLGAIADQESPTDWKPSACWQLPLKVERRSDGEAVLRRWSRDDWGRGGRTMHWWCTEEPAARIGERPVAMSLAEEIEALVGPEVAVAIRRRVADD